MKISHNVSLTFIQFLFRYISFYKQFGIGDFALRNCSIDSLYHLFFESTEYLKSKIYEE